MAEIGDQKGSLQTSIHRFPILGPENGEAFIELVTAMQDLGSELDRLKYPFRKTGAIWSLQSQENYKAASWRSLPTVLYKHAFDVAMSIRKHHPQQEWESTASPRKRLPATWDGRWQRVAVNRRYPIKVE